MKFRVCFILEKYEYDILSLCETTNVFMMLFCYSKIHFQQLGSFKFIKTMCKSLNVCKVYPQCGIVIQRVVTKHWLPSVQLSGMMNWKIELQKISVWAQSGLLRWIRLLELIQLENIIKMLISCYFSIWPPLGSWAIFFNTIPTPDCKRRVTQHYLTYLCTDIN